MRFASLGSGSRGNGTLIESGRTRLLIDCGFSLRETERQLVRLKRSAEELTAVLVTHEHSDHVSGVGSLARKYKLPVWMTSGTFRQWEVGANGVQVELFSSHEAFPIGDFEVTPFPVPHDAREPCQFTFSDGAKRLGMLTDLGRTTPHVEAQLDRCHALVIECNHEPDLLQDGPYPPFLKARVGGGLGHLSNWQAAEMVGRIDCSRLQHVVAAHLSEQNNTPERAREALAGGLNCKTDWIGVAKQDGGFDWREVR